MFPRFWVNLAISASLGLGFVPRAVSAVHFSLLLMDAISLSLLLVFAQRPEVKYTLGFYQDTFVVRNGNQKQTIARVEPVTPKKLSVSFRRDKRWAVWDERGLTTRSGTWVSSDKLESISVSPKAQTRDEILATVAAVKAGKRTKSASALSGARRIGNTVYFLGRWEETDGTPWLEALVSIDLTEEHPKPKFLGRFEGLSLAKGAIDDQLTIRDGGPAAIVRVEKDWGVARFAPKTSKFDFLPMGTGLQSIDSTGRIIEGTSYGTTIVGQRGEDDRTAIWLETHGPAEFVAGEGENLVLLGDRLRNVDSGAEIKLVPKAGLRRSKFGLLVYWPEDKPRSARLYDAARLEERARWELGTK